MKLSRLWQPRSGLFWLLIAFNALSSLGAWALRTLAPGTPLFAAVALLALLNCAAGLLVAWRLVRDEPTR